MSANPFVASAGEDYREHEGALVRFLAGQVADFNAAEWRKFDDCRRDAGFMAVFVSSVLLATRPAVSDRFYAVAQELLGEKLTADEFDHWLSEVKLQAPRLSQSLLHAIEVTA